MYQQANWDFLYLDGTEFSGRTLVRKSSGAQKAAESAIIEEEEDEEDDE